MTDYTSIADSQIDPKAPVTSELLTAYRDNPIAIAEGAAGAPKIAESWQALETTSTSGLIVTDVDNGEGVRVLTSGLGTAFSGDTISFRVSISSDNGATFVSEVILKSATASAKETATINPTGTFVFDRPTGAWVFLDQDVNDIQTGTFPSSSAVTDIRFRFYVNTNPSTSKIAALAFVTGGKATT